jgi:hypothetical protein
VKTIPRDAPGISEKWVKSAPIVLKHAPGLRRSDLSPSERTSLMKDFQEEMIDTFPTLRGAWLGKEILHQLNPDADDLDDDDFADFIFENSDPE